MYLNFAAIDGVKKNQLDKIVHLHNITFHNFVSLVFFSRLHVCPSLMQIYLHSI
jgi:hypothetical protein